MATRDSVENFLQECVETIKYAQDQFQESRRVAHDNQDEYLEALMRLENAYNELNKLMLSANEQQREQLQRIRIQLEELQHSMIVNPAEW